MLRKRKHSLPVVLSTLLSLLLLWPNCVLAGRPTESTALAPPLAIPPVTKDVDPRPDDIRAVKARKLEDIIRIENNHYLVEINAKPGLVFSRIKNRACDVDYLIEPSPLFFLRTDDGVCGSDKVRVRKVSVNVKPNRPAKVKILFTATATIKNPNSLYIRKTVKQASHWMAWTIPKSLSLSSLMEST